MNAPVPRYTEPATPPSVTMEETPKPPSQLFTMGETPKPPGGADLGFVLPEPARLSRARGLAIGAVALVVLAVAFLVRWLPARQAQQALAADARGAESTMPRVQIVTPLAVSSDRALSLPGSVQSLEETVVYPRASGYVHKWHVDLGDKVREGDLLAEIETPELDQQLVQARAQLAQAEAGLAQARANAQFSRTNLERYRQLLPAGLASQQDFDKQKAQAEVDVAGVGVAGAGVGAQRANIQMLTQLKAFSRVTAPFAGIVTTRSIERGALVSAGTATPLFKITATDPARVFVQVPQDVAPSVRIDVPAHVTLREFPGRIFEGRVARSAGALDPTTRTMLTEVRVPNPDGTLLTGMYAQVALVLPAPHRVLSLPATAILNDATGVHVSVVDASSHIHQVPVVIERDTGPIVEVSSGLSPTDRVVKLPNARLIEGREVEVAR